jgi:hypothetical protein
MLSDSMFQAIELILEAVQNCSNYSINHKQKIILALTNLYSIQYNLDRNSIISYKLIRRLATVKFNEAIILGKIDNN